MIIVCTTSKMLSFLRKALFLALEDVKRMMRETKMTIKANWKNPFLAKYAGFVSPR
jgi:hypothetical protein